MPYKCPKKQKEYLAKHYQENKDKYRAAAKRSKRPNVLRKQAFSDRYKLYCGCQRCGFKESVKALEYHHIDPSQKDNIVSNLIFGNWSLKVIKREIRKCVVLCANCHRIVHEEIDKGVKHKWKGRE